ncbi:hypothetical protein BU15DRAFT_62852 [Melanogaster broomeanus]|nr:hypothetical protein BU15DRAFT_62852 [Melanogaster broomeanus]
MKVVIVTAIAYDYILTFPQEVKYIWVSLFEYLPRVSPLIVPKNRPWTWMSTLFLLVRYLGPLFTTIGAYYGGSFIPGPVTSVGTDKTIRCTVLYHVYVWSNTFFFAVTDLVMLLRVYAMYHRSRTVLSILLAAYVPSVVVSSLANTIYKPQIEVSVLFGATTCTLSFNAPSNFSTYFLISYVIISAVLCGFAIVRLVRESLQMHRAIKKWRSNQYLELLVRENVLYFIAYLFAVIVPMVTGADVLQEIDSFLLYMFAAIPPVVLPPRLIISVREFHSRVVGDHIDTGFGAISRGPISANESMVFVNVDGSTERIGSHRSAEETSEMV